MAEHGKSMRPFLEDLDITLYCGDALEVLRTLPDESVHMACTSPPFFGLRDYGTGTWEGGDEGCDHLARYRHRNAGAQPGSDSTKGGPLRDGAPPDTCGKCGARRVDQQIGLEATVGAWVARLVEVFREVRRVMRHDATLWLELGDSYGPNKQLQGTPWRLAFALQDDGWILRSEIVWSKLNPMPEAVSDRPTTAHSRVFLLTKSPRYFYDAEAIREPSTGDQNPRNTNGQRERTGYVRGFDNRVTSSARNRRSVWTIATQPYPEAHFATWPEKLVEPMILAGTAEGGVVLDPFAGSGTTLYVARRLGRRAIGIELSESYSELAAKRLAQQSLLGMSS